jgi:hypothetical protein
MKYRNVIGAFAFYMIAWSAAAEPLNDEQFTNRAVHFAQAKPPNCERSGSPDFRVCCKTSQGAGCVPTHRDCSDLKGLDEVGGLAGCDHIFPFPPAHQFPFDKYRKTVDGELKQRPDLANYKRSCLENAIKLYNGGVDYDQAESKKEPKARSHPYLLTDDYLKHERSDAESVYVGLVARIPKIPECKK